MTTEAKGAKPRLSARQREVLENIELNCRPVQMGFGTEPKVIPAYTQHLEDAFAHMFFYESQLRKFLENLEARGFIRIEKRHFIYITDAGKLAVGANTP